MSTVTDQKEPGVIESITQGISSVIQGKPEEEEQKEEEKGKLTYLLFAFWDYIERRPYEVISKRAGPKNACPSRVF